MTFPFHPGMVTGLILHRSLPDNPSWHKFMSAVLSCLEHTALFRFSQTSDTYYLSAPSSKMVSEPVEVDMIDTPFTTEHSIDPYPMYFSWL